MVKTFVAQNIASINPVTFQLDAGTVVGLLMSVEVNYGEIGLTHQVNVWSSLNPAQKQKAKDLYAFLQAKAEQEYLS